MATFSKFTLAASATLAAACAPVDPGLGEALKYDMALQTVDPDPVPVPGAAEPGTLGTTAARAAESYRTGAVKDVSAESTTEGSGTSSGPKQE